MTIGLEFIPEIGGGAGPALVRVGPAQAVGSVGAHRVQDGVAQPALAHLAR